MSIPFRESDSEGSLAAGFIRILRDAGGGFDGALFVMNARGEPLEFVFTRVDTPRTVLWRPQDLKRRAAHELVAALFNVATSRPTVVFAQADEVDAGFFTDELVTQIPTCRVAADTVAAGSGPDEPAAGSGQGEPPAGAEPHAGAAPGELGEPPDSAPVRLIWSLGQPAEGSAEHALAERLRAAGLLGEPFARAEAGLREARGLERRGGEGSGSGAVEHTTPSL